MFLYHAPEHVLIISDIVDVMSMQDWCIIFALIKTCIYKWNCLLIFDILMGLWTSKI